MKRPRPVARSVQRWVLVIRVDSTRRVGGPAGTAGCGSSMGLDGPRGESSRLSAPTDVPKRPRPEQRHEGIGSRSGHIAVSASATAIPIETSMKRWSAITIGPPGRLKRMTIVNVSPANRYADLPRCRPAQISPSAKIPPPYTSQFGARTLATDAPKAQPSAVPASRSIDVAHAAPKELHDDDGGDRGPVRFGHLQQLRQGQRGDCGDGRTGRMHHPIARPD